MLHGMPFLPVKGGCKPFRNSPADSFRALHGGFCKQWERGQLGKGPSCKGSWFCQSLNAPRACVVCLPSPPGCNFRLDSPMARFEFASTRGLVGWIALSVQKAGGCSFVNSAQRRSFLYRCAELKGGCRRLDGRFAVLVGAIHCMQSTALGIGRCMGELGDHVWPCLNACHWSFGRLLDFPEFI